MCYPFRSNIINITIVCFFTLRLSVCVSVSVCVRYQNIWKKIEPINFIFGGSLPSNPDRKPFDLEKLPRGKGVVCVCMCVCVCGGGVEI